MEQQQSVRACVYVHVVYMLTSETERKKTERKRPLEYVCRQRQGKIIRVCVPVLLMRIEMCVIVCG